MFEVRKEQTVEELFHFGKCKNLINVKNIDLTKSISEKLEKIFSLLPSNLATVEENNRTLAELIKALNDFLQFAEENKEMFCLAVQENIEAKWIGRFSRKNILPLLDNPVFEQWFELMAQSSFPDDFYFYSGNEYEGEVKFKTGLGVKILSKLMFNAYDNIWDEKVKNFLKNKILFKDHTFKFTFFVLVNHNMLFRKGAEVFYQKLSLKELNIIALKVRKVKESQMKKKGEAFKLALENKIENEMLKDSFLFFFPEKFLKKIAEKNTLLKARLEEFEAEADTVIVDDFYKKAKSSFFMFEAFLKKKVFLERYSVEKDEFFEKDVMLRSAVAKFINMGISDETVENWMGIDLKIKNHLNFFAFSKQFDEEHDLIDVCKNLFVFTMLNENFKSEEILTFLLQRKEQISKMMELAFDEKHSDMLDKLLFALFEKQHIHDPSLFKSYILKLYLQCRVLGIIDKVNFISPEKFDKMIEQFLIVDMLEKWALVDDLELSKLKLNKWKGDEDCLNNPFFVKYFSSLTNVNFQIYFLSKSIFSFFQKNKMDNVLFSQQFVNIINLLFSTLLKASLSKEEKAEIYDILFSHPVKVYRLVEEQGKKPKWKMVKDKLYSDKNTTFTSAEKLLFIQKYLSNKEQQNLIEKTA